MLLYDLGFIATYSQYHVLPLSLPSDSQCTRLHPPSDLLIDIAACLMAKRWTAARWFAWLAIRLNYRVSLRNAFKLNFTSILRSDEVRDVVYELGNSNVLCGQVTTL